MLTTISIEIWRLVNIKHVLTECTQIFGTRGCGNAITVFQTVIANKATFQLFHLAHLFLVFFFLFAYDFAFTLCSTLCVIRVDFYMNLVSLWFL